MTTLTKKKPKPRQFDPTDGLMELAKAIDAKREEAGITVSSLETAGAISQGTWGKIMKGGRTPTLQTLTTMAEAVGLELSLLLEESG